MGIIEKIQLYQHKHRKKIRLALSILLTITTIWLLIPTVTSYDFLYGLSEVDEIVIYDENRNEVARTDRPMELLGTAYDGRRSQITVPSSSWFADVSFTFIFFDVPFRINLRTLYRLDFIRNNEVVSTIEVLGGRTRRLNTDNASFSEWLSVADQYVVLRSNRKFFSFIGTFNDNLSDLINGSLD